jgi:two-component system sensor histidine kinase/response regulator
MEDPSEHSKLKFYLQDHILSMALESIAECVSITDEHNKILYVNRAFLKTYGYSQEEVVGQHINVIRKSPVDRESDFILKETITGGWKGEVINLRKTGEEFPVLLSTSVITDNDGSYLGLIGVANDISEDKKKDEAYKVLVDHLIQGLLIVMGDKITFSNERAVEILGYPMSTILQWQVEDLFQLFHPLERKKIRESFHQISHSDEKLLNDEFRILLSDNEQKWIQLTGNRIALMEGNAIQLAFIDVTERKTAEIGFNRLYQQLQKQNLVFEELLRSDLSDFKGSFEKVTVTAATTMNVRYVSIWLFNEDETVLTCVERYNKETNSHDAGIHLSYASNPEYFNAMKSSRMIAVYDVYSDNRTRGFSEYFQEMNIKSMLDVKIGYGSGFSGVVSFEEGDNIRFWQEDEIAFALRIVDVVSFLLEDNKRSLAENALRDNEKKLRELIITKDKFFSILAHDLKNPYNAIVGFSDLLEHDDQKLSDDEQKVIIKKIKDSANTAYKLLENLLDWSGLQTGLVRYNPENSDISGLVNETIHLLKSHAENKAIQFIADVKVNTFAWVDREMIKTVLRNLVSNGIHYSKPGGRIWITAEMIQKENIPFVLLRIADEGVGISEENLKKLFRIEEKFHINGTAGEKGTGLGLILCKDFININHGDIWVKSQLEKGSDFHLTLPVFPPAEFTPKQVEFR